MKKGYKQLLAEANAQIETIPVEKALDLFKMQNVTFIDIRDFPELDQDGRIPGSIHASRGMLEFYADPESPYYKDIFSSGNKLILYCASGGRSALAAQRLQEMGLSRVAHIGGGFNAWKEVNGPVERLDKVLA